jgi:hypothetical protein
MSEWGRCASASPFGVKHTSSDLSEMNQENGVAWLSGLIAGATIVPVTIQVERNRTVIGHNYLLTTARNRKRNRNRNRNVYV